MSKDNLATKACRHRVYQRVGETDGLADATEHDRRLGHYEEGIFCIDAGGASIRPKSMQERVTAVNALTSIHPSSASITIEVIVCMLIGMSTKAWEVYDGLPYDGALSYTVRTGENEYLHATQYVLSFLVLIRELSTHPAGGAMGTVDNRCKSAGPGHSTMMRTHEVHCLDLFSLKAR